MRNSNQQFIISQHIGNIMHLKSIPATKNIITAGSDGQLHLYGKQTSQSNYEHISSLKLFQSPIVSCDISKNQQKSIVVAAFSGQIKVCKIVDRTFIIVQKELIRLNDGPIISCIWSSHPNHLIATTQLGILSVIDYKSNSLMIEQLIGTSTSEVNICFVRSGDNRLFYNRRNLIYEFEYSTSHTMEKKLSKKLILNAYNQILDFIVSDQSIFLTLAVLTQNQLIFFLLAQKQVIKISAFKLEQQSFGRKLGWGTSYDQMALYYCSQGKIKTNLYIKSLNGKWSIDSKGLISNIQNKGAQMKDIQ